MGNPSDGSMNLASDADGHQRCGGYGPRFGLGDSSWQRCAGVPWQPAAGLSAHAVRFDEADDYDELVGYRLNELPMPHGTGHDQCLFRARFGFAVSPRQQDC